MNNREALRNAVQQEEMAQKLVLHWKHKAQVSGDQADWNQCDAALQDVMHWRTQQRYYDMRCA